MAEGLTHEQKATIKRAYDAAVASERDASKVYQKAGEKLEDAQYELERQRGLREELERTCEELSLLEPALPFGELAKK